MNHEELCRRGLAAFKERDQNLYDRLVEFGEPISNLVIEDGRAVNVAQHGVSIYPKPADEYVREEIDAYFEDPERVLLKSPEGAYCDSPVSLRVMERVKDGVAAIGMPEMTIAPNDEVGFLIVIGLGLGLHVEELIERVKPRHVLIVEPNKGFLRHSLSAVDWERVFALCDEIEASLDFLVGVNPQTADGPIFQYLADKGMPFLDGGYLYTHFKVGDLNLIRTTFKARVHIPIMAKGFFEDEVLMTVNAADTFRTRRFMVLDAEPRLRMDAPAFIVGAGPSVTPEVMEVVRKWKDHAMIFASGTAEQVLLANGIRPDFHCEVENLPMMPEKLDVIRKRHDDMFEHGKLKGVAFVGPISVDPRNLDFFEESYLYFRDSISSTRVFGKDYRHLYHSGPLAANVSTATALTMGFHRLYFFGVDCGVRSQDKHHADDTIYYTSLEAQGTAFMPAYENWDFTYPGNFGGEVYTDSLYDWSRHTIEMNLRMFRATAANCTDGARIEGARPQVPKGLRLDGPPIDKAAVKARIRDASPVFEPPDTLSRYDLDGFVAEWDRFMADFTELMDGLKASSKEFRDYYEPLREFFTVRLYDYQEVHHMVHGSAMGIPNVGRFIAGRYEKPEDRRKALEVFMEVYAEEILGVSEQGKRIYENIRDGVPNAPLE